MYPRTREKPGKGSHGYGYGLALRTPGLPVLIPNQPKHAGLFLYILLSSDRFCFFCLMLD